VNLVQRWAQFGRYLKKEVLHHRALKRAGPIGGCRVPVVIGVLIHIERGDMMTRHSKLIDEPRRQGILRHRTHRKDSDETVSSFESLADPAHNVKRELKIEPVRIFDHLDMKLRVRMSRDLAASDSPHSLADFYLSEGNEAGE
jgi:hypothetical protein